MPLRESKKELRTVLDHMSDGVMFIDGRGIIRLVNRTLTALFHIDEDITGIEVFSLPSSDPLRQGIVRSESTYSGPYCWERERCTGDTFCPAKGSGFCRCWLFGNCGLSSNGKKLCRECSQYRSVRLYLERPREIELANRTMSVVSTFIDEPADRGIWEIIVFKDVTHEKLDAAIKIAGAAAHELRQPLQAITSCAALLEDACPDDPEFAEIMKIMRESCRRMDSIIEKIGHIASFRTKKYVGDYRILDIDRSSDEQGGGSA